MELVVYMYIFHKTLCVTCCELGAA